MRQLWICLLSGCLTVAAAQAAPTANPAPNAKSPAEAAAIQQLVKLNNDPTTGSNQLDTAIAQFQTQFPQSTYLRAVLAMGERYHKARSEYYPMLRDGLALLTIAPDDLFTLSTMGEAIPDNVKQTDLDADQRLAQAEGYDRQVINTANGWMILPTGLAYGGRQYTQAQATQLRDNLEAPAYISLGRIASLRSDYPSAVSNFTQALTFEPTPVSQAQTWYDIGQAQLAQQHTEQAKAAFQKALALAPNEPILDGMVQAALDKIN